MGRDIYIAGIGASAGGAEAIINLFTNMPLDTGLAFIIVRHLKPDYVSYFPGILEKYTKIPIIKITGSEEIEPNTIYIMPENKKVYLDGIKLILEERPESEKINSAIDDFFFSLSKEAGDKAIGIILSGAGFDGVRGAKAIHENGGMVLVQNPGEAAFKSMPIQAINLDHPKIVYAKEMGSYLQEYVKKKLQKLKSKNN